MARVEWIWRSVRGIVASRISRVKTMMASPKLLNRMLFRMTSELMRGLTKKTSQMFTASPPASGSARPCRRPWG